MSVKTITITDWAYTALKNLKSENESFSDAIGRLTKERSLLDFAGILSEESGDNLVRVLEDSRKIQRKLQAQRDKRLWGR